MEPKYPQDSGEFLQASREVYPPFSEPWVAGLAGRRSQTGHVLYAADSAELLEQSCAPSSPEAKAKPTPAHPGIPSFHSPISRQSGPNHLLYVGFVTASAAVQVYRSRSPLKNCINPPTNNTYSQIGTGITRSKIPRGVGVCIAATYSALLCAVPSCIQCCGSWRSQSGRQPCRRYSPQAGCCN